MRLRQLPRAALDVGPARAPKVVKRAIVDQFHRLYYHTSQATQERLEATTWMGTTVNKFPTDLWTYQELLHRIRPAVIVETGTAHGGSALYFAGLCDLLDRGRIVTVDISPTAGRPPHRRITHIAGSSTAPETVEQVRRFVNGDAPVFVVLDSDHSYAHVRDELAAYAELVTPGSYLVVEDTNIGGHPVLPQFGPGPMEAVREFLAADHRFVADRECEKFLMTQNPGGYLRRVA